MSNPIRFFENLKDAYLRYIDSPFDIRYADLVAERRRLLDRDGRIYRLPLIEPVPAYRSSNQSFAQAAQQVLTGRWQPGEITALTDFVSQGLFPSKYRLHRHQRDAFEHVVVNGRDIVVTTGTGSGKTECFLLPIVASILRESVSWATPNHRPAQWDWWNSSYDKIRGTGKRQQRIGARRISQRQHENRPPGVRALILYPFNALVEDQLARLRESLDSSGARAWLDANRNGNRIYFGRYTGNTPVSGGCTSSNTRRLREELREIAGDAQKVADSEAERFFQSMDGAEMWSRWDMQDAPPDILITNYSMLNIMLMRAIETTIFDRTRKWLEGSPDRIFHLVVDELHTYRGTPGTEVAYLLRVLLDRLGLTPESDQLRIISSSASLESGTAGLNYLEQFFGRDRGRFEVIGGPSYIVPPDPNAPETLATHAGAFAQFGRCTRTGGSNSLSHEADTLLAAVGVPTNVVDRSDEEKLTLALERVKASDALRIGCTRDEQLVPQTPEDIALKLFPDAPQSQAEDAADGLLTAFSYARNVDKVAPLPMRVHLMLRNLQGIWACSNPNCNQTSTRTNSCPIGVMHYVPTLTCQCGSRVLELLNCEACGEIFLGGYRRATDNPNEWRLSPDHPNLEAAPDLTSLDRDYDHYAIFGRPPGISHPQRHSGNSGE